MGYFDNENNVNEYFKMADGFDGRELIDKLKKYLKPNSTVLELGMGPGKDLDILKNDFIATGSDNSKIFIELYKKQNPDSDVLVLDAVTIDTDRKFNCIYSNKVLHHLTKSDLKKSISRQKYILLKDGILFHSFWKGDKEEFIEDLRFVYYTKVQLEKLFENDFEVLEIKEYTEMEENDSIYLIVKKK